MRTLYILGIRGLPAKHGGFESFAERLALYLISQNWKVAVYCQEDSGTEIWEDYWNGVKLIHIPIHYPKATGTIIFDWKATLHAARQEGLFLTLGYNTAIFCGLLRLKGLTNIINMDGLEWKRQKWNNVEKAWLYINELLGCWFGNHLIADHPEIKNHLITRVPPEKVTVIPYGADRVVKPQVDLLKNYNLEAYQYIIVIARPEPENSILEIVSAFSRKKRGYKLLVLGKYYDNVLYHQEVKKAASEEVIFPGAIYEKEAVNALRYYARLYIHGHTVGGTNPSLVEAMSATSPILAHDNKFNRWVAGVDAHYFSTEEECAQQLDSLLDSEETLNKMREGSLKRYNEEFAEESDVKAYEKLFLKQLGKEFTGVDLSLDKQQVP